MVDILDITTTDLKEGKYKDLFPDLYSLKGIIERTGMHDDQDAFEHTLSVFEALRRVLFEYKPLIQTRLSQKIDKLTREEILILTAILHDIGKKYTVIAAKGVITGPGHENISSQMILNNNTLNLSSRDRETFAFVVSLHGLVNQIALIYEVKKNNYLLRLFSQIAKGWVVELVLFILSDLEGSDLKKLDEKAYLTRKQTHINMLNYFLRNDR